MFRPHVLADGSKGEWVMSVKKRKLVLPIIITLLGLLWVLQEAGLFSGLSLVIAAGLGVVGLSTLLVNRRGRGGFVVGVLLLMSAALVLLRLSGMLSPTFEAPLMVCIMGGLLFLAQYLEGRGV
jgi:hypothetical protein